MSSWMKRTLAISACLPLLIACAISGSETPTPLAQPLSEPAATDTPAVPPTLTPVACPVLTDKIIRSSLMENASETYLLDEDAHLVTYIVSGNEISDPYYEEVTPELENEQSDLETHRKIWDYFAGLIPLEWREVIGEYSIVTDGKNGGLAAVTQTFADPYLWALEVDIADSDNSYDLTFTLIHEFGHLLTLGPEQVPPSLPLFNNPEDNELYLREVAQCPQYFPGEGCANADSYINAFYNQFWVGIHEEWNDINLEENGDAYYARLDEFYYEHEDQFLTSYAVTNPEEDIAEAWSFFVLAPKPAGDTIAREKILFFYQYPELVQLRARILESLCASFPE
jgi:hypothetical protein